MAHLLTYADASGVLCYESTSRAMRDLVQSFETSLWSALLRATWPREGEALASLGNGFFPRSDGGSDGPRPVMAPDSCRRIFRAFRTSRDARTNIARLDANGVHDDLRGFMSFIARQKGRDLSGAATPMNRLAFLVTMGEFSGLAMWHWIPDGLGQGREKFGLRWSPRVDQTLFRFECSFEGHNWWSPEVTREKLGSKLQQSIHVIDVQSFECVQFIEDVQPESIEILETDYEAERLQAGDLLTYSSGNCELFRHNREEHFSESSRDERLIESDRVEACMLEPFATLRPVGSDGSFRLDHLDLSFDHGGSQQNVRIEDHFLDFIADVVKQTHAPVTGRPGDDYNSDRTSYTSDSDGRSDY